MPGIVAIAYPNRAFFDRSRDLIRAVCARLLHEKFYYIKYFEFPQLKMDVAKVELDDAAIRDEIGYNEDKTICCVLSGELFNSKQLERLMRGNNHHLDTFNPSELIAHLYEDEGFKFLNKLNGCHNVLLVDLRRNRIVMSNDRFGLYRCYYARMPEGGFLFAPELKCFQSVPGFEIQLDGDSIIDNFKYNCIRNNKSFFKNVNRLPIATFFMYDGGAWSRGSYWNPENLLGEEGCAEKNCGPDPSDQLPPTRIDSALRRGSALFEQAVERSYTEGETGLSLTGGWDTRAILSVLYKKGIRLPCYTFGGMYRDSFDVRLASKLAHITENRHTTLVLGSDFLTNFESFASKAIYISDGIAKVSTCQEYYLNKLSRELGTIRLTGKFGSQLLRGATMLKDRSPNPRIFSADFRRRYADAKNGSDKLNLMDVMREEFAQYSGAHQSLEMAVLRVRTPYLDNEFVDHVLRYSDVFCDKTLFQKKVILSNSPEFAPIPINRGVYLNARRFHFSSIVYKALNFIDTFYNWERVPNQALPVIKLGELCGVLKYVNGLKEWTHYRLWFLTDLKDFVHDIILDKKTLQRPWYDENFVKKMISMHYSGMWNFTAEIDKIISFELWCRQFVDT